MVVQRSSDFIAKVSDKATPFAIHHSKRITTIFFMRAFRALIEDEEILMNILLVKRS
jgi:hypothetical protein